LPGGYRTHLEDFNDLGNYGYWWSSTENFTDVAFNQRLGRNYDVLNRGSNVERGGLSVRCLRD
jgi:uncharacterized protein (TIGR02145 family)